MDRRKTISWTCCRVLSSVVSGVVECSRVLSGMILVGAFATDSACKTTDGDQTTHSRHRSVLQGGHVWACIFWVASREQLLVRFSPTKKRLSEQDTVFQRDSET